MSAYKYLSRVVAKARYERRFPEHLIRDVTRAYANLEPLASLPRVPAREELERELSSIVERYAGVRLNPWEDQEKRVIVLIEKEAQFELVKKLIRENFEFGVHEVVFSRGYDSATDMIRLAREIKRINERGQRVVLLIISDFDPSGEDIASDYVDRLLKIEPGLNVEAEKIAVTKEQVVKYNLPCTPESAEEVEKMRRDPRFKSFYDKHGLMRVELDAFVALKPDEFKRVLIDSIRKHFDYGVYESVTKKREEQLRNQAKEVKEKVREMLADILRRQEG